jgi:hypothetical protein
LLRQSHKITVFSILRAWTTRNLNSGSPPVRTGFSRQWRTVDPLQLEALAADLWNDEHLRALPPAAAAVDWLRPIEGH